MRKFVFISGLHRSGTSILHRTLSVSDYVSGFSNTGVPEDEGQHLQSVYKAAKCYGGPGNFAFDKNARLDEHSELISPENKEKLLSEWGAHWDNEKPIWIEKSPPNIIRMRFLQELFPDALFVTIMRHPIAVSYATQKMSHNAPIDKLIEHWVVAHDIYQQDRMKIKNEIFFSYEYMVQFPEKVIAEIGGFLDTEIPYTDKLKNYNAKYFNIWTEDKKWQFLKRMKKDMCIKKYEKSVNKFGYSLIDLEAFPKLRTTQE